MADNWTNPNSVEDANDDWANDQYVINGSLNNYAYTYNSEGQLECRLTQDEISDKIRIYLGEDNTNIINFQMKIYHAQSGWKTIHSGENNNGFSWINIPFATQYIRKIKVDVLSEMERLRIHAIQFNKTEIKLENIITAGYVGDYKKGDSVNLTWGIVALGVLDGDIFIIKNNADMCSAASAGGITHLVNKNSQVGVHSFNIDTTGGFYETNSDYSIVFCGTQQFITANITIGSFSIENRSANNQIIEKASQMLVNKAIQNKLSGAINYYDNTGENVILTHNLIEEESEIIRMPE